MLGGAICADCCYCMGKIAVPEIKQSAQHVETICPIFRISIFNFVFLSYSALKVVVVMLLLAAAPGGLWSLYHPANSMYVISIFHAAHRRSNK